MACRTEEAAYLGSILVGVANAVGEWRKQQQQHQSTGRQAQLCRVVPATDGRALARLEWNCSVGSAMVAVVVGLTRA